MKKWLFLVFVGLLFSCNDNEEQEPTVGVQPRFLFSELNITQTTEGLSSSSKRTYNYEDGKLLSHTFDQYSIVKVPQVSFSISTSATSHIYRCFWKGENYSNYYNVTYSVNTVPLATHANYVCQEGDSQSYTMEYTVIDGKYYLKAITEFIQGAEYYVLTFDYSRFGLGEIGLTQTLLGNDRVQATLHVTRDNKAGIPDVHLNDAELHPLDKHFEAIYGGLFGTFDYFISEISKETKTAVSTTTETITSSIEFDDDGYPQKITSVSDKKSKKTKYFEFSFSEQ